MFLIDLIKPQIAFGSSGGSSGGGGGGGGGGSSKSKKSSTKVRVSTRSSTPKSSGGGKGSKSSGGRNRDADAFAGSNYAPTKNAGTSRASQVTYTGQTDGPSRTTRAVTGSTTNFNSPTSVSANDLAAGRVNTFKANSGTGSLTVARGTKLEDTPQVQVGGPSNTDVYNPNPVVGTTSTQTSPVTGPSTSSDPVVAPERIEPKDGVGGGRDGGTAKKSKASKTAEDKVAVERKAQGVEAYKVRGDQAAAASSRERRVNKLSIKQNRGRAVGRA